MSAEIEDLEIDVIFETDSVELNPSFGENSDYNLMANKPHVNSVELTGDKTSEQLGLQSFMKTISNSEIDDILYGGDDIG